MKAPGVGQGEDSLGFAKMSGGERESLALVLLALKRQRQFTYDLLVGVNFTNYYTNPYWASARVSLVHRPHGLPQQ